MDYNYLVGIVDKSKWQPLSDKLVDLILTTKNDEKIPSNLANNVLHLWKQDRLVSESGLAALLEAALKLEPEKTLLAISDLQLAELGFKIKEALQP
ncbi:MAG TPA: hypothetical protein VJ249_02545 [Candidatus Bathyarchaeia archaeon]|nr:hypothetical protein [Candidatus Bathyarchaeia archaeon]